MVRVLTLMDNTAGTDETAAEHGLSFLVERDGSALLFDTGGGGTFLSNGRALGADTAAAAALVVSHGHCDHSGGVRALCEQTGFSGVFWSGEGFFDPKWAMDAAGPRSIGSDFDADYLADRGLERRAVAPTGGTTAVAEALPGLFVLNGFPRVHPEETQNPRFVVDRRGGREVDDFRDEVCLAVDLPAGVAVILGCAHPGAMNMLDAVRAALGKPVVAILGGSHLVEADEKRVEATISHLKGLGCSLVALGHCTGKTGIAAIKARLASYQPLHVGARFEL